MVLPGKLSGPVKEFLALYKDTFDFYSAGSFEKNIEQIDKVILVDINQLSRVSLARRAVEAGARLIIYDHHPYTENEQKYFQGIIEPLGATATIMVKEIRRRQIQLNPIEATILALGIHQDTGSLRFLGTTTSDAEALAYLLGSGANLAVINTFLERPLNMEQQQLYNLLLANGEEKWINGNQILLAGAKTTKYIGGIALIARKLGDTSGADVVLVAVASPRQVDLVARSRVDWVRVDELMRHFGGGGHAKAGSAKVKGGKLEELLEQLDQLLPSFISAPLTARDLMSSPVKSVKPQQTISEAARLLLRYGHSGMPVVDDGKLVGIISRRDVDKAMHHNLGHAPVKAYMSRQVKTVEPDIPMTLIEDLMINHDIGRLPVCENGVLVGIVSRTDLLKTIHREYQGRFSTNFRLQCPVQGVEIKELLLQRLEPGLLKFLEIIGRLGQERDELVFLVGGIVRDLIIGCPNIDIDVVVEGDGPQLARQFAELTGSKVRNHDTFQTATVFVPEGYRLDFVSARREFYPYPAALPTVESARIKEDLYRRDFTVNAMAISLNPDSFGLLVDYFCGYSDLMEGLIRVLHNLSFVEDPTRIIRAVRFCSKYGWQIEEETYGFMLRALKEKRLAEVSLPRLWNELKQILLEDDPVPAVEQLAQLEADKQIFRGMAWDHRVQEALKLARKGIRELEPVAEITAWRAYLAVLLSPCSSLQIRDFLETLLFNKRDRQIIVDVFELKSSLPYEVLWRKDYLEVLHRQCRSKVDETMVAWGALSGTETAVQKTCTYLIKRNTLKPKLTGHDLIGLGLKPGPGVGAILKELEMARLTGKIKEDGEELCLAKELIKGGVQHADVQFG